MPCVAIFSKLCLYIFETFSNVHFFRAVEIFSQTSHFSQGENLPLFFIFLLFSPFGERLKRGLDSFLCFFNWFFFSFTSWSTSTVCCIWAPSFFLILAEKMVFLTQASEFYIIRDFCFERYKIIHFSIYWKHLISIRILLILTPLTWKMVSQRYFVFTTTTYLGLNRFYFLCAISVSTSLYNCPFFRSHSSWTCLFRVDLLETDGLERKMKQKSVLWSVYPYLLLQAISAF